MIRNILGITRGNQFSPNMSDKDMAIMRAVASRLESLGHEVRFVDEFEWVDETDEILPDAVFTMMRSQRALKKLKAMEERGITTLNASEGILNAERWRMTTLLREHQLPVPTSIMIPDEPMENISTPCWVKQGKGWAQKKDDVTFVTNHQQLQEQIHRLMNKYADGNVVATFTPRTNEVLSPEAAYQMVTMLRGVINSGTGRALRSSIRADMGGKTGTTNSHADGWFMGFTPHLVVGAWVGGDDRDIHFDSMSLGQGARAALPIYHRDGRFGIDQDQKFEQPEDFDPCYDALDELRSLEHVDDEVVDEYENQIDAAFQ